MAQLCQFRARITGAMSGGHCTTWASSDEPSFELRVVTHSLVGGLTQSHHAARDNHPGYHMRV